MNITKEQLDFITRGLAILEARYMNDYHEYRKQDNESAAQDCLDYFHRVYTLRESLLEESDNAGTEIALV